MVDKKAPTQQSILWAKSKRPPKWTTLNTYMHKYIYIYRYPPGQRPRKTWPFNFAEKDLLLLDEDLLLLGPFGSKVKMMAMDVQQ